MLINGLIIALKILLGLSIFLWLVATLALWFFQEKFIFFPPSASETYQPTAYQPYNIQFNFNQQRLNGWYIEKNKEWPVIIYFGGNASDVGQLLRIFDQQFEANLLLLQYRGYGKSSGKPSQKALFEDALAEYDWLIEHHHFKPEKIFLIGQSLGTGVATYLASQRQVQAVILITPYASIRYIAAQQHPLFPVKLLLRHPFNSVDLAPHIKVPLLALLAEQDHIIPRANSLQLHQAWGGEKDQPIIINNSTHLNILQAPAYQKIRQFIKRLSR